MKAGNAISEVDKRAPPLDIAGTTTGTSSNLTSSVTQKFLLTLPTISSEDPSLVLSPVGSESIMIKDIALEKPSPRCPIDPLMKGKGKISRDNDQSDGMEKPYAPWLNLFQHNHSPANGLALVYIPPTNLNGKPVVQLEKKDMDLEIEK